MKRNYSLLFGALLALGLMMAQSPKAWAQYGMTPPGGNASEDKSEPPSAEAKAKVDAAITAAFSDAAISSYKKMASAGTNDVFFLQFTSQLHNDSYIDHH